MTAPKAPGPMHDEYGYTLSHDSDMTGGHVHGGFDTITDAAKRLGEVLRAQQGADGVVIHREKNSGDWRVSKRESLWEFRIRMGWVG